MAVGSAGPDILDAKLHPPPPRQGVVDRSRLLGMLSAAPDASVVAVIAPLGYGKTTLLTQASAADPRPTAWVTLDRRDDDPVVLIAHIVAALEPVWPDRHALDEVLTAPGASVWWSLMPRLGAVLAEQGPTLLVLDDIHEIGSREAADVIVWLALHVPAGSRLVIGGRSSAQLALSRLRVDGHLLEIGASDLALSDDEAADILRALGVNLPASDAAALNTRCEGWAGGLQLSVLAGSTNEAGEFVARPTGSDHLITDYVRTEVLARLQDHEVRFLLRTSILRALSAGLCDAVLETTGSGDMLLALERSNALVAALDRDHVWYRYHDLFRESLVAELERTEPTLAPLLRHRAAEWHAAHAMGDEAVRYEQESGDILAAARLIGRLAQPQYDRGHHVRIIEWLDWVESVGMTGADPTLSMTGAVGLAMMGEAERSSRWASAMDRIDRDGPMPDGSPAIEAWQMVVRCLLGRDGVAEAVRAGKRARELIPVGSPWRCLALTGLGMAQTVSGASGPARSTLAEAVETGRTHGAHPNSLSVALAVQGRIALQDADPSGARGMLAEADEVRQRHRITELGPQAIVDAVGARLAIMSGNRPEATGRLARAQRLRPQLTWAMPSLAILTRLELARAHLALADPAGARTMMREVGDILHRRPGAAGPEIEIEELRGRLADIREGTVGLSTLTTAELRLVPMLATHLTFHEIGDRLFISTNTVKTQAMSIYRKLDATSRTEAVEHAARAGLLDAAAVTAVLPDYSGG